jgi:hypothetical protein
MRIYETIIKTYPELENNPIIFTTEIILRNDSDGLGDYIETWNYEQPIPKNLKLGKDVTDEL